METRRNRRRRAGWTFAAVVGLLLTLHPSQAAAEGTTATGETLASREAPEADKLLDTLLRRTQRQIADGHGLVPLDDNALDTWQQVIATAFPVTPATMKAMAGFAAAVRLRSTEEATAGRDEVASIFKMFARLAENYVLRANGVTPETEVQLSQAPVAEPSTPASTILAMALATARAFADPPPPVPVIEAAPAAAAAQAAAELQAPTDVAPAIPTAMASVVPTAAAPPRPAQDAKRAAFYAARGDEMLAIRDITAARRFYEFAANAGSARAATALARTYEENYLHQLGVVGLRPDPDQAAIWYARAQELGDVNAEDHVTKVKLQAAQ